MRIYSEDHLWVDCDQGEATLGISAYAAAELGEVTYVELPAIGAAMAAGGVLCVVESLKTAADLPCPVSGRVMAVNDRLTAEPGLLSGDPEGDGWICRLSGVAAGEVAGFMSAAAYAAYVAAPSAR
ncbi:MAG: glycine cleavage system protein H [Lentisphaerae bacterium]|nr:glycine cleavage system protein H [Lentisphaerota bacterium]